MTKEEALEIFRKDVNQLLQKNYDLMVAGSEFTKISLKFFSNVGSSPAGMTEEHFKFYEAHRSDGSNSIRRFYFSDKNNYSHTFQGNIERLGYNTCADLIALHSSMSKEDAFNVCESIKLSRTDDYIVGQVIDLANRGYSVENIINRLKNE